MPLRDHFRPPVWNHSSWEGFHGGWPAIMVQQLSQKLPPEFTAEPRVHFGSYSERDFCAYERDEQALVSCTGPEPTLTLDAELGEQYEYEVLIYDQSRGRSLVAAVEIVSPANKDRPETRRAFVAKCSALLQKRVCVSIVDLVTTRHFNLYTDLLDSIDRNDPAFGSTPPPIYAATCRGRRSGLRWRLESWEHELAVGAVLPTLPIWLAPGLMVPLELEATSEDTCRSLRIR